MIGLNKKTHIKFTRSTISFDPEKFPIISSNIPRKNSIIKSSLNIKINTPVINVKLLLFSVNNVQNNNSYKVIY